MKSKSWLPDVWIKSILIESFLEFSCEIDICLPFSIVFGRKQRSYDWYLGRKPCTTKDRITIMFTFNFRLERNGFGWTENGNWGIRVRKLSNDGDFEERMWVYCRRQELTWLELDLDGCPRSRKFLDHIHDKGLWESFPRLIDNELRFSAAEIRAWMEYR